MKLALLSAVIAFAATPPAGGQLRALPGHGVPSSARALALSVAYAGHSSSSKSSKSSKGSKSTKGSKSDDMSMTSSKSTKGSKSSKSDSAKSTKGSKSEESMSMTSSKGSKSTKATGGSKSGKSDSAKSSKGSKSSKSDMSISSKSAKSSKSSKSTSADEPLECLYETPMYFIEEEGICVKDADVAAMCADEPIRRRLSSKSTKSSKSSTSSADGMVDPANCANLFVPAPVDEWTQIATCCTTFTDRNETIGDTDARQICLDSSVNCGYQICGDDQRWVFGVGAGTCTRANVPVTIPFRGFGVYPSQDACCVDNFNDTVPLPPFGNGTCQTSPVCTL